MNVLKSPLSYWGSKLRDANDIISYFPPVVDKTIYVELFCGSSIIFFNYKPRRAVLNDNNRDLINFWNVLRTQKAELERELEFLWPAKSWCEEFKARADPVGRAVAFYMLNRSSFGGKSEDQFRHGTLVRKFNKDFTKWKAIMDSCTSLTIWDFDFRTAMEHLNKNEYTSRFKMLIYADPPYFKQSCYKTPFSMKDHEDLCDLIHKCDHQVILSYGDEPWVREHYKDFEIIELESFHTPKNTMQNNVDKSEIIELLISNKPLKKNKRDNQAKLF